MALSFFARNTNYTGHVADECAKGVDSPLLCQELQSGLSLIAGGYSCRLNEKLLRERTELNAHKYRRHLASFPFVGQEGVRRSGLLSARIEAYRHSKQARTSQMSAEGIRQQSSAVATTGA